MDGIGAIPHELNSTAVYKYMLICYPMVDNFYKFTWLYVIRNNPYRDPKAYLLTGKYK